MNRAIRIRRDTPYWEPEISAWSWRGVVSVVAIVILGDVAVDPLSLPFGSSLWPIWALETARILALAGVAVALRWLARTIGALSLLFGARPLAVVAPRASDTTLTFSRLLGRSVSISVPDGTGVRIYEARSPKFEHRGRAVAAAALCDWVIQIGETVVTVELPWTIESQVLADLTSALAPCPVSVSERPLPG